MPNRPHNMWATAAVIYADRLLAFGVPLFLLKGLHNTTAYTAVEFIISLSVMIVTFGDLGIRNYILYQYRQTRDKSTTTKLSLAGYCCILLLQVIVIGTVALIIGHDNTITFTDTGPLVIAALIRAGALGATTMAYQLAVLHNRPELASLPSLVQWLMVLAVMIIWPEEYSASLGYAIAVPCLPMMVAGLLFTARALAEIGFFTSLRQIASAARWAWPLLASAALSIGIANVSRIYGFSHLAQPDQVALNFWLRILSVIQLTHATAMTTLAMEIYDHHKPGVLPRNLIRYLITIFLSLVCVIGMFAASVINPQIAPTIGVGAFVAISAYTLAWCLGAYLETYVTRDGRTYAVMTNSAVAAATYMFLLLCTQPSTVATLALIMSSAAILNLLLLTRSICGNILKPTRSRVE